MTNEKFRIAAETVIGNEKPLNGIGTYSESTLHAVLKNYYEPDPQRHELGVGKYVADIVGQDGIIEIQTKQLFRMKEKIRAFLAVSSVTVVFPVIRERVVVWRNAKTGEIAGKGKSPKHQNIYSAMAELYSLREFITDPGFRFTVPVLAAEDRKDFVPDRNGKKTGVRRFDCIPTDLIAEESFNCPADYEKLLPAGLPIVFSSDDFAKNAVIKRDLARITLNILFEAGIVERVGRDKKGWKYSVKN
ncbi:MAG: hypothetical protein IJL30_07650 [Clostridia bacterium]|nr:hypothetical protein [Clostridia bacterium]